MTTKSTAQELSEVLSLAQRSGVVYNNGAGGQYLLCATASQLLTFTDLLASPPPAAQPAPDGDVVALARTFCDVTNDSRGRETFEFDKYGLESFATALTAKEGRAAAPVAQQPVPCTLCNALTVPRNQTHHDADDLAAAQVVGKAVAAQLAQQITPAGAQPGVVEVLRHIKSSLMHHRRFGVATFQSWRQACTIAEGDIEELLNALKQQGGEHV